MPEMVHRMKGPPATHPAKRPARAAATAIDLASTPARKPGAPPSRRQTGPDQTGRAARHHDRAARRARPPREQRLRSCSAPPAPRTPPAGGPPPRERAPVVAAMSTRHAHPTGTQNAHRTGSGTVKPGCLPDRRQPGTAELADLRSMPDHGPIVGNDKYSAGIDLKLFELKTICPLVTLSDRGSPTELVAATWIVVDDVSCRLTEGLS
jgi:hypothetical protein